MFLILASMPVLNLLTKYTTTPTINFKLFPWPPPFAALSSSRAKTAPVFFTAQEMPGWQHEKGLAKYSWLLLWLECGNNEKLSHLGSASSFCYWQSQLGFQTYSKGNNDNIGTKATK